MDKEAGTLLRDVSDLRAHHLWSALQELPATLTGDRRHVVKFARTERLVVAYRDVPKSSFTSGHHTAWVGRFEDTIAGKPGDYRVKLFHGTLRNESDKPGQGNIDCGYSDVELLAHGTIIATTYLKYAEDREKHSVMNTRLALAETDAFAGETATGPGVAEAVNGLPWCSKVRPSAR